MSRFPSYTLAAALAALALLFTVRAAAEDPMADRPREPRENLS